MLLFLLFFISFLDIVSCSLNVSLRKTYMASEKTPHNLELLAQNMLNFKLSSRFFTKKSMFTTMTFSLADLGRDSLSQEYRNLMVGLDIHIRRYSLNTSLMASKGTLTDNDRQIFLKKIKIVIEEEIYFKKFGLVNFQYCQNTIDFVFAALKAVDPTSENSIDLIAGFAKYCTTDSQLKEPLSLILKGLEVTQNNIPFIQFNDSLDSKETRNFDYFISECFTKYGLSTESELALAKNIIFGPITQISSIILFSLFRNTKVIRLIGAYECHLNRMIFRVLRSDSYDAFMRLIETCPEENNIIRNVKNRIQMQQNNLCAVNMLRTFEPGNSQELILTDLEVFSNRPQALQDYYKIDKKYVEESVLLIYAKMTKIIDSIKVSTQEKEFNAGITVILKYLSILPNIKIDQFEENCIEIVLDLLENPLANAAKHFVENSSLDIIMVVLPYFKLDCSVLIKLYRFYSNLIPEYEAVKAISLTSIYIIGNRIHHANRFQIFKELHKFHESVELNMQFVVLTSIIRTFSDRDFDLFKQILDHAIENQLLTKTYVLSSKLLLKSAGKFKNN